MKILDRIVMSKKVTKSEKQSNSRDKEQKLSISISKNTLKKIITFGIILIIFLLGSVLVYSQVLKGIGDKQYKSQKYSEALQTYYKADSYWFPKKINGKLRDGRLEVKIIKAQVMVRSGEMYVAANNDYQEGDLHEAAKKYSQVVQNDPNYQDAQNQISIIENKLYPTKPTATPQKTTTINQTPKVNAPQINCTGPDGKLFKTTEAECKNLKDAWAKVIPPPSTVYLQLGQNYISNSGLTVRLNNISKNEESSSYKYIVSYTQENKTTDKKLDEGTLVLIFEDGTKQNQYGFFNFIFPGQSLSREYTFQILRTQKASSVEFNDNSGSYLKWKIQN